MGFFLLAQDLEGVGDLERFFGFLGRFFADGLLIVQSLLFNQSNSLNSLKDPLGSCGIYFICKGFWGFFLKDSLAF